MSQKNFDELIMKKVLALAAQGKDHVEPNPLVGCIIVQDDEILAASYHAKYGENHAERNAILKLSKEQLKGATLYVNLEPCCHQGKTPPCTDIILESGIQRVVVSLLDPNPLVSGKGVQTLQNAGIQVDVGILEQEAQQLNHAFIVNQVHQRAFLLWKFAMTLDGHIAAHLSTEDPQKRQILTSEKVKKMIHTWRGEFDAILVGSDTVKADNPRLTNRFSEENQKNPIRIVITRNPAFLLETKLMDDLEDAPLWVATLDSIDSSLKKSFEEKNIRLFLYPGDTVPLDDFLADLYKNNIYSILMEGGSNIGTRFLKQNLVDELRIFIAPKILGGTPRVPVIGDLNRSYMNEALSLSEPHIEIIDDVIYIKSHLGDHHVYRNC